jgi:folate-dependent phosphoribosylglycinamide formyltransferase PurN
VSCPEYEWDTPETLANRIHALEHKYYPAIIEAQIKNYLQENKLS